MAHELPRLIRLSISESFSPCFGVRFDLSLLDEEEGSAISGIA